VGGVPLFRAAWFPLAFLGFGIPLPDGVLIGTLGDPLRDQAARWSADLLDALGYSLLLDGTQLRLPRIALEVGYECSEIRGLIAAAPLGAAFAYMFHSSWWQRALLLLAAVPIGLASNILRVVAISIRVYDFPSAPTLAELHGPTGWIPVLFIVPSLLLISWLMRWADQRLLSGSR
jgi:exosortase